MEKLYDFKEYELDDFVMRKSQGRKKEDYKSQTDLILKLIAMGEAIGMEAGEGTSYHYVKTKTGYKLRETVKSVDEIDMRYYWQTVSTLLDKFGLKDRIRKRPPLTLLDEKQKSLMEWI
jgi:hypothetical protein